MTELQERALLCLYRRAFRRAQLRAGRTPTHHWLCQISQAAGKGAQPEGEPYDLLRWDRMDGFETRGLVKLMPDAWTKKGHVRLTPAGCREAEQIIKRREIKAFRRRECKSR